jgi:hypothetical protein
MTSALVAHEQAISRIFSNDYVFNIPSYQRPYAWTTEQARDLLDDLVGFMKASGGEVENMPPYFLGSIWRGAIRISFGGSHHVVATRIEIQTIHDRESPRCLLLGDGDSRLGRVYGP